MTADPNYVKILDFINLFKFFHTPLYTDYRYDVIKNIIWENINISTATYNHRSGHWYSIRSSEYTYNLCYLIFDFISIIQLNDDYKYLYGNININKTDIIAYEPIFLSLLSDLLISNYDNIRYWLALFIIYNDIDSETDLILYDLIIDYLKEHNLFNLLGRINPKILPFYTYEEEEIAEFISNEQMKLRWTWLGAVYKAHIYFAWDKLIFFIKNIKVIMDSNYERIIAFMDFLKATLRFELYSYDYIKTINWDKIKDADYLLYGKRKTYKYNIIGAYMIDYIDLITNGLVVIYGIGKIEILKEYEYIFVTLLRDILLNDYLNIKYYMTIIIIIRNKSSIVKYFEDNNILHLLERINPESIMDILNTPASVIKAKYIYDKLIKYDKLMELRILWISVVARSVGADTN